MPSTKAIVSIASALIIGVPLFGYVILNYDNIVDERVLAIETSIQKNPDLNETQKIAKLNPQSKVLNASSEASHRYRIQVARQYIIEWTKLISSTTKYNHYTIPQFVKAAKRAAKEANDKVIDRVESMENPTIKDREERVLALQRNLALSIIDNNQMLVNY